MRSRVSGFFVPLVGEHNAQSLVQEGLLLQVPGHQVAVEAGVLKNGVVGEEAHQAAFFAGIAHLFQGPLGDARGDLP